MNIKNKYLVLLLTSGLIFGVATADLSSTVFQNASINKIEKAAPSLTVESISVTEDEDFINFEFNINNEGHTAYYFNDLTNSAGEYKTNNSITITADTKEGVSVINDSALNIGDTPIFDEDTLITVGIGVTEENIRVPIVLLDENTFYQNFHFTIYTSSSLAQFDDENSFYVDDFLSTPFTHGTESTKLDNAFVTKTTSIEMDEGESADGFAFETSVNTGGIYNEFNKSKFGLYTEDENTGNASMTSNNGTGDFSYDMELLESNPASNEDGEYNVDTYKITISNLVNNRTYSNWKYKYITENTYDLFTDNPSYKITIGKLAGLIDLNNNPPIILFDKVKRNSFQFQLNIPQGATHFDKNATVAYAVKNDEEDKKALQTELIQKSASDPSRSSSTENFQTYTYLVSGLDNNTKYSDISIEINNESMLQSGHSPSTYVNQMVDLGQFATVRTHTDSGYLWIIVLLVLIILLIILIILLVIRWWRKNIGLAIYGDGALSVKEGQLYFDLVNARRNEELWNASPDELSLYANGRELPSVFFKSEDVRDGYKILISGLKEDNMSILSLLAAMKYNTYEISFDEGKTRLHANSLKDSEAKKMSQRASKERAKLYEKSKDSIVELTEDESVKKTTINAKHGIVSIINKEKSTPTSMRYILLAPETHPLVTNFDPESKALGFFHVYNGKCYRLEHKFISSYGSMFEYDIINLKPGRIYVGLSTTVDGGKTTLPSAALFGVTKNKDLSIPSKTDAILAKPNKGQVWAPMWLEHTADKYIGEKAKNRTYDVIVKKHWEDKNKQALPVDEARSHWDEYKWLKGTKASVEVEGYFEVKDQPKTDETEFKVSKEKEEALKVIKAFIAKK